MSTQNTAQNTGKKAAFRALFAGSCVTRVLAAVAFTALLCTSSSLVSADVARNQASLHVSTQVRASCDVNERVTTTEDAAAPSFDVVCPNAPQALVTHDPRVLIGENGRPYTIATVQF